jgi:clan AA aspartic protease (TIGR02281 family)
VIDQPRWIILALAPLLVLLWPGVSLSELYKWVDENGTTHYSSDYNTLPKAARQSAAGPRESIEVLRLPSEINSETDLGQHDPDAQDENETPDGRHEIRMQATPGGNHIVYVKLNRRVTVPMILDTGASDVVITEDTAVRLGLTNADVRGHAQYSTANGIITQPIIMLANVSVGTAKARAVRGSVSGSMPIGLLGTSFLKAFEYTISDHKLVLKPKY